VPGGGGGAGGEREIGTGAKLKSFSQFFFTTRHSTKTNTHINYDDYRYYLQNPNDAI